MAATLVSSQASTGTGSTSCTVVMAGAATSGNLVVIVFTCDQPVSRVNTPSGFTAAKQQDNTTAASVSVFYKIAGASEPSSYTITTTVNVTFEAEAYEVSGLAAAVVDVTNSATSGASTVTSIAAGSTGTLATADEFVVTGACTVGTNTGSEAIDSGFTILGAATFSRSTHGYKIVAATTALNPTHSWATALKACAAIVAFKAGVTPISASDTNTSTTEDVTSLSVTLTGTDSGTGTESTPTTIAIALDGAADTGTATEDTSIHVVGPSRSTTGVLDGIPGQVTEDVRFEVLDTDGNLIDILHPSVTGTVTWNPTNRISRTLSGVRLDPTEAVKVTAGQHRIRPVWVYPLTGSEYALGVFLYLGGAEVEQAGGTWVDCSPLPDRSWQLDQKLSDMLQLSVGSVLTTVYDTVANSGGVTAITGSTSTAVLGDGLTYLPKKHSRLDALTQLADLLAYLPPHFDADGNLVRRPVPVPTDDPTDHTYYYGQNSRILADTVTTSTKLAPNVYIVESTSPAGTAVSARYDVPDSAPNSRVNIGFEILPDDDLVIPGLVGSTQALAAATARAQRDAATATTVTFTGTPDPRHDCYGIVDFDGTLYLEVAWTLELTPGGKHQHVLAKAYT